MHLNDMFVVVDDQSHSWVDTLIPVTEAKKCGVYNIFQAIGNDYPMMNSILTVHDLGHRASVSEIVDQLAAMKLHC